MVEGGRKFGCNKCGTIFDLLERFVELNRTHVGPTVGIIKCTVCGTKLGNRV